MKTIDYSDVFGYGTVHAHTISIHVYDPPYDGPTNPIALISSFGTHHFGMNRVLFQMN
ncbi:hypothetical protein LCGC14_2798710 [marine sediment metagenome]|uniref:Uncharacterized protein n=1 Tax=marine sediment metagenome TaxID=412755 RepID=A0A0F8ZAH0_9ZZZZ